MCASLLGNASGEIRRPVVPMVARSEGAAPTLADASVLVPGAVRLVALPKMTEEQIKDFIADVLQELELSAGYRRAGPDAPVLPRQPDSVLSGATAMRKSAGKTDVLQFGYVMSPRRSAKLMIYGVSISAGSVAVNPDASEDVLNPLLTKLLEESVKTRSRLRLTDLQPNVINLSYIDADGALFALRAMGYSAVTGEEALGIDDSFKGRDIPLLKGSSVSEEAMAASASAKGVAASAPAATAAPAAMSFSFDSTPEPVPGAGRSDDKKKALKAAGFKNLPSSIDFDRLPLIYKMPAPEAYNVGLVGANENPVPGSAQDPATNALGLSMIPSAATPLGPTISSGTSQLLVLTHPDDFNQFTKIKRLIEDVIDKPARQVFVEGLVLEVSKQAIEELGVQWQNKKGTGSLQIGTLVQLAPGAGQSALQVIKDSAAAVDPRQFMARINALVDRNKAEILSRPSILTLDNRQATIRVGTDIPIATSKDASSGAAGGRVAFSFQYLPTGILLNVRPRINQEGREISMLIDATVSATVPGQDLRVIDPTTGITLASAPSISTRRVQTYARIANNTPLIIGGLVSRDQTKQEDKVPGMADVPFLGKLFGYERSDDARREVIIVLTPSVLTEELRATKPQLPKDDDRFDLTSTTLFREAYRIRAEDLIDSQYIRFNKRLLTYRTIVNNVIARHPEFEKSTMFSQFRGSRIPGEFVFVSGMMHRMLTRLKAGEDVNIDKLAFFEGTTGADFNKESVGGLLKRLGDGKTHAGFFAKNPGKALTLRFSFARESGQPGQWATEPLAEIKLVDCPDRQTWKKLLWDMNQPVDGVQKYYTIVIQDESDLERLKIAIALKNTILNNGNEQGVIFDNFLPGRMVALQGVSPDWERTLEGTIARYYYYGELFYPAFADAMESAIRDLDTTLRRPAMAPYLEGVTLP